MTNKIDLTLYVMEGLKESIANLRKACEELESYELESYYVDAYCGSSDVEWETLITKAETEINHLIEEKEYLNKKLKKEEYKQTLLEAENNRRHMEELRKELEKRDFEVQAAEIKATFNQWHSELDEKFSTEIERIKKFMLNTPIVNLDSINDPDIGMLTIDAPFEYELIRTKKGIMRYVRGEWVPLEGI